MVSEVIVAVYETAAHAADAVKELESAGIPSTAIHQFDQQHPTWEAQTEGGAHRGFWATLFGSDEGTGADHRIYDETVTRGGTVVSVTVPAAQHDHVMTVLERFNPIDLDDRSQHPSVGAPVAPTQVYDAATTGSYAPAAGRTDAMGGVVQGEQVIALAEEQLQVGKRMVDVGRTRIRRYVVETPVEERVRLRTERVVIERRRPITGSELSPDAFTETSTEVIEREEQAVVAKTARIGEEVVVRTEAGEREETVRDTVRREDVEITRDGKLEGAVTAATTPVLPVGR